MRMRLVALLLLCLSVFLLPVQAEEKAEQVNKMVEPTHLGPVIGQVYDAISEKPLQNASVCIQEDGVFPPSPEPSARGKAAAKIPQRDLTDTQGRYQCQAELGRISSNIDVGRLLSSSVLGLLSGSAKKVTKRIDITFLTIRAECPGYQTFEGAVPVKRRDMEAFTVVMEPILLLPDASPERSTVANGWGVAAILAVEVNPSIARPGAKVNVTARVKCPPYDKSAKMTLVCYSPFGKMLTLSRDKTATTADNHLQFSAVLKLPSAKKARAEYVVVSMTECPYDMACWGQSKRVLLQVAANDRDNALAQLRQQAYRAFDAEQNVEAAKLFQTLCADPAATMADYSMLADVSEMIHDYPVSVTARKHILDITPKKEHLLAMGPYARALLLAGQQDTVLREVAPELKKVKAKERVKKVPIAMPLAVGGAYLKGNQLKEAVAINEMLNSWPSINWTPDVWSFRGDLRLAQVEADLRDRPEDAQAWANYGRALMDMKRWEEAAEKLGEALKRDPNLTAVQWELNYALLYARGKSQQGKRLDDALAAAQQEVIIGTGKKQTKSKNFFAWHAYGILQFRKANELMQAQDETADTQMLRQCRETLMEALVCGREGKETLKESAYYGLYLGYYGSEVVGIAGFAYPEANQDFIIVEGMKVLDKHPDDALTRMNMASAFIELELPDLAFEMLRPIANQAADRVELQFLQARIALLQGQPDRAMQLLRTVVEKNPRHPFALTNLAQCYSDAGDMVAASTCLAAHAKYYRAGAE